MGMDAVQNLEVPFEIKADVDEAGKFTGYGAVFNNVDSWGDIIVPGAFAKFLKTSPQIPMLWQHDRSHPIGIFSSLAEDNKGLLVDGQLALGVQKAAEARELMMMGAIKGLSIGYRVKVEEFDRNRKVRLLKEINPVLEISLVTFPANQKAKVTRVKEAIKAAQDPRALEKALCDAGLSRSEAKFLATRHDFANSGRDAGAALGGLLADLKQINQQFV